MAYNISTMHIWRLFNGNCECPMCKLRKKTESDIAELYLSEAVMEDAEREKVNKFGFCKDHNSGCVHVQAVYGVDISGFA